MSFLATGAAFVVVAASVHVAAIAGSAAAATITPEASPGRPTASSGVPGASDVRLAGDELAVFFAPEADVTPAVMASVARRLGALGGPLPGSTEFVMFVRLPGAGVWRAVRGARSLVASEPAVAAVGPVYYREGSSASDRVVPTGDVVVTCRSAGALRRVLRTAVGRTGVATPLRGASSSGLLRTASPLAALEAARELDRLPGVVAATPDCYRPRATRAVPDDPLFARQWHLDNRTAGVDVDVVPVWDAYRGSAGEVVAIVDDGVELTHADLAGNVVAGLSWDYVGGDAVPAHERYSEGHGTACAGVAAARGFNGRGVSGAAPRAGLVGLRLLGAATDANEAAALSRRRNSIDIYSCSWGPDDDRHLEAPGPVTAAAIAAGTALGRGGRGSVYVWAGGNGLAASDDSNYDGYANSRFVAAVAACDAYGGQSWYSERGADLLVTAPSSGAGAAITTTDRSGTAGFAAGAYTSGFGGTSSSAPLAAGSIALMLQANPDLTWRDVQAILATTAVKVDAGDADWKLNGAGHWVNHKYGFGLIDTAAAVAAATTWTTLGAEAHAEASASPAAVVPDDDPAGVASQVTVADDVTVESVDVVLDAPHTEWSDLQVELVSPAGTPSLLAEPSPYGGGGSGYSGWRFMTRRCLGESSRGVWTLRVSDRVRGLTGRFDSWTLIVHGRPTGAWVDETAPVTSVMGAAGWHGAPATVEFDPFDPDSAIARTESRLDGGPWLEAPAVTVPAPADHGNDGIHLLEYHSFDVNGPVEDVKSAEVKIDTRGPVARAPRRVVVRRGALATLPYRVNDLLSPRATVTIRVKTLGGRTVKTATLRDRRTGTELGYTFRCTLRPRTYRFEVTARDLAGNRQTHTGSNRLVVR